MSNIQIETDLKEILQELKDGQKSILNKVEEIDKKVIEIDKRLVKVETKLESELPALQKSIDEIKGSQKAQIWTLIGILYEILKCLLQIKLCKGERPFAPTNNVLHSFLDFILITADGGFIVAVGRSVLTFNP